VKQGQNCEKIKLINGSLGQRGQAVVEYVLLLVVIVSMVMAAKGLFSGVNAFIGNYVGKYFACLMDHGELPQLNVAEDKLKQHVVSSYKCSVKFSIANGATLTGGGGGSSGVGGTTSVKTSSKSDSSSTSKNSNSSSSKNKRGGGVDDSSSGGGSSGSGSAYAKGRIQRSNSGGGTADGASDGSASKTKVIEEDQVGGSAYGRRSNDGGGTEYRYQKYKAITSGQMFDDIQKKSGREARKPGAQTVSKLAVEEGFRPGPRKNAFIPPERKPAVETEDIDPNFGFGKMMKWLMIAGMVVAIIVFFGGQMMNYSNSD
jgi:hypothetical protein